MVKSLFTILLFALAVTLLFEVFRPRGAEAMIPPSVEDKLSGVAPLLQLPDIQGPFDATPITPVESTGAPMYP
ncbi:hypothetical protein ACQUZK_08960 [Streptococcus pyogenes]|uniref:hypothetical protein n=1 Tax=Streptococcus pyogenes TaxID=1314 RepID=UPI003DA1369F